MQGSRPILAVSLFLADQLEGEAYSRWTERDLFSAFIWALAWLAQARPGTFVSTVDMTLQEGALQNLPRCCNSLVDTPSNTRVTTRTAQRLVSTLRRRCPPALTGSEPYKITSYSYDDSNPYTMLVSPPVPKNAAGQKFAVTCTVAPTPASPDEDVQMDDSLYAAVVDLMIFHVATGENESPTLRAAAELRYRSVRDQLGMNDQQEQEARTLADQGKINVAG